MIHYTDDIRMFVALPEQDLVLEPLPPGDCQIRFQTLQRDNVSSQVARCIDGSRTALAYLSTYRVRVEQC